LLLQNQRALEQRLKDAEAELNAYRKAYPQANIPKAAELPPQAQFTMLDSYNDEQHSSTMAPSQASFESPDSLLSTLDSPLDTAPSTPGNEMTANDTDLTQHSAVSVGYHQQLPHLDAKLSLGAELPHPHQYSDLPDDGTYNTLFDFDLFPDGGNGLVGTTESFFDSSFESSASNTTLTGNPNDIMDPFGASLFDLQPGAGATLTVSDAPGIAAE
jgi:hypothetical protein